MPTNLIKYLIVPPWLCFPTIWALCVLLNVNDVYKLYVRRNRPRRWNAPKNQQEREDRMDDVRSTSAEESRSTIFRSVSNRSGYGVTTLLAPVHLGPKIFLIFRINTRVFQILLRTYSERRVRPRVPVEAQCLFSTAGGRRRPSFFFFSFPLWTKSTATETMQLEVLSRTKPLPDKLKTFADCGSPDVVCGYITCAIIYYLFILTFTNDDRNRVRKQ